MSEDAYGGEAVVPKVDYVKPQSPKEGYREKSQFLFPEARKRGEKIFGDLESLRNKALIPLGGSALDVGMGGGGGSFALQSLGYEVSAIDDESSLGGEPQYFINRRAAAQVKYKRTTIAEFSTNEQFDLILFAQPVLERGKLPQNQQSDLFSSDVEKLTEMLADNGVMLIGYTPNERMAYQQLVKILRDHGQNFDEQMDTRGLNHRWIMIRKPKTEPQADTVQSSVAEPV